MRRRTVLRGVGSLSAFAAVPTVATESGTATEGNQTRYASPASVSVTGASEAVVSDDGTTVYVAANDGFAVVDVSDFGNPTVLAERRDLLADRENGPLERIYDVTVSGDRLLVAGPNHGTGDDVLSGILLYDVSDPTDPERLAFFETDHGIHNAFLDGDTAYLTGTGASEEPLVVVDVSGEPEEIARWSIVDENADWLGVKSTLHACHDVYVQNDTAYVAYWDAGTWLVDVSDPANPTPELQLGGRDPVAIRRSDVAYPDEMSELPGNSHYAAPNEDGTLLAIGREAWDGDETDRIGGPGGITLWDVGNRSSPERLVRIAPPAAEDLPANANRTAHNFGFRGDRLYASWYEGGVRVYDVSSPAEPELVGAWAEPEEAVFWTAQPADGGFVASSVANPSEREQLSIEAQHEPVESAALFTFPEPSGENARPARTGSVTETEGAVTGTTTASTRTATKTTARATTRTSETTETVTSARTTADGPTSATATKTTTESSSAADTPGFGVASAVVGGGLALARLLQRNRE